MIGLGLKTTGGMSRGRAPAWTPARLFSNGEQGVWYEPKPEYLYQDAAGTVPVTANGDPVGLMLDLSKGLVKGPELVTNGTFDTDLSGWTDDSTGTASVTYSGGEALFDGESSDNRAVLSQAEALTAGKTYEAVIDVSVTSGFPYWGFDGSVTSNNFMLSAGINRFFFDANSSSICIFSDGDKGFNGTIDNISVRELPGNHATQSTSAARPIYRTDGTLHWLEFDGVDDHMSISISATASNYLTGFAIDPIDNPTDTTDKYLFDSETGRIIFAQYASLSNYVGFYDGSWKQVSSSLTARHVLSFKLKSGSTNAFIYQNSEQVGDGNSYTERPLGGDTFIARSQGTGAEYEGDIYGIVIVADDRTDKDRLDMDKYLASISGVTL